MHGIFLRWGVLLNVCLAMAAGLAPGWAYAQQATFLRGAVTRVIDGDTLTVRLESGPIRVRLHGMDAPEMDQPGGPEAKRALTALVQGGIVELQPVEQDRYERLVAVVRVGALEINREMIRQGHAWAYRRHMSRSAPGYCTDEARARNAGRGLWRPPAELARIAPWEWRRRKTLAELTDYSHESVASCVAAIGRR